MSVNTRQVKLLAFVVSSFFAGIAGGLFAHLLQFINPRMFDIIKSTDILIMVYLGGIGSIAGSILGAVDLSRSCSKSCGPWVSGAWCSCRSCSSCS